MAQVRTPKMLIRVCDKCRCELSNDAPIITLRDGRYDKLTIYDFCIKCMGEIFSPYGHGREAAQVNPRLTTKRV